MNVNYKTFNKMKALNFLNYHYSFLTHTCIKIHYKWLCIHFSVTCWQIFHTNTCIHPKCFDLQFLLYHTSWLFHTHTHTHTSHSDLHKMPYKTFHTYRHTHTHTHFNIPVQIQDNNNTWHKPWQLTAVIQQYNIPKVYLQSFILTWYNIFRILSIC